MRIGVLELMSAGTVRGKVHTAYNYLVTRQYASIMPQVISVWSRSLGHEVHYATYYGCRDPKTLLPAGLDVVFISTYTQASALAYALAKLYRAEKTLTVIGGPHARQFPEDCLRFFDIVVGDCDRTLISEILKDKPRGLILNCGRALQDLPGIEERLPEIRASNFLGGKPYPFISVPLLTSTGCPNSCDFCIDWNTPYHLLPLDRFEADMRFIMQNFPRVIISLHDPNFAVNFEQVFDVLDRVRGRRKNSFVMETSLSVLRDSRLKRLKETGNFYIVPGIESWMAYSGKVGAGPTVSPRQKLEKVIEQCKNIRPYVRGVQANFIFGLDVDAGDLPLDLTREFTSHVPYVMPNFNIPVPFGSTPLYEKYMRENRLLTAMPFTFYYLPYLVFVVKNYSPAAFYEKLIEIIAFVSSRDMLLKRLKSAPSTLPAIYILAKTLGNWQMIQRMREILHLLKTDAQFRAFHEHETDELPEFYHRRFEHMLGPYAGLISREERKPVLIAKNLKEAGSDKYNDPVLKNSSESGVQGVS